MYIQSGILSCCCVPLPFFLLVQTKQIVTANDVIIKLMMTSSSHSRRGRGIKRPGFVRTSTERITGVVVWYTSKYVSIYLYLYIYSDIYIYILRYIVLARTVGTIFQYFIIHLISTCCISGAPSNLVGHTEPSAFFHQQHCHNHEKRNGITSLFFFPNFFFERMMVPVVVEWFSTNVRNIVLSLLHALHDVCTSCALQQPRALVSRGTNEAFHLPRHRQQSGNSSASSRHRMKKLNQGNSRRSWNETCHGVLPCLVS